jgi:hypothetical protein
MTVTTLSAVANAKCQNDDAVNFNSFITSPASRPRDCNRVYASASAIAVIAISSDKLSTPSTASRKSCRAFHEP